jgi:pimeloyl-ACP methyl ester carboxylesterase
VFQRHGAPLPAKVGYGTPLDVKVDGRLVSAEVTGADDGWPVFLLHGTPGSRTGPKPRSIVLSRMGVRLIAYDRPGYGGSGRQIGRSVADAAADVAAIADHLGLTKFSVLGRSGGGPHALACAALLPDRVVRASVLVSLAPSNAPGLDWLGGMTSDNVDEFSAADSDVTGLVEKLRHKARNAADDPVSLLEILRAQMTEPDRRIVRDVTIRRLLTDSYWEALKDGPYGWIDDVLALRANWEFEPRSIAVPLRIWHGAKDNFAPASHAAWLKKQIPAAELELAAGSAHFGAMEVLPVMLGWLAQCGDNRPVAAAGRTGRDHDRPPGFDSNVLERVRVDNPVEQPLLAKR